MSTFDKWKGIAASLHGELLNQIRLAVEENKDFLIALNEKQLDQGKAKDGSLFLLPYSKSHARKRSKAGLQTSRKDLKFHGDLRQNIYVLAFEQFYEIGSKDSKTKYIEDNERILGSGAGLVFGLTDENKSILFTERIKPRLQSWFQSIGKA